MDIITTSKGKQKVCLDGFMYTQQITSRNQIRWQCVKRHNQCKGIISTSLDLSQVLNSKPHNHDANLMEVEVAKTKVSMKHLAANTRERPASLVSTKLAELPAAARPLAGSEEAMKKMIRRVRKGKAPPAPASLREFTIEGEWAQTSGPRPEPFLIYDNGQDSDSRIVVFASPPALRTLSTANTWFMDGNFAMAPPGFLQLYVIRVPLGSTTIGVTYALLQRKTQDTYEELFQALLDKCNSMELYPDPRTILVDFEQAVISAIQSTLGNDIQVRGCFYHLTQETWRKIQELGLVRKYRDDEDFKLFCGQLDALAFLPIEDIPEGITYICTITPIDAEGLVDYFDQRYVTGTFRRAGIPRNGPDGGALLHMRRVPPRYPPALWNVHQATLDGEARTNNQCEGWNNRFTHLVGYQHPSVWTMIDTLKKEDAVSCTHIAKDLNGQPPKKRIRREYKEMQIRLHKLCEDRAAGRKSIPELLSGVGHNIRWKPVNRENDD